jgi:sterol desaturase/sphingolipid hydroxylase (fatty acid hydroxylase superfamily)
LDKPLSTLDAIQHLGTKMLGVLFSPGSGFSIYPLACALLLGGFLLAYRHKQSRGSWSLAALRRAIVGKRVWRHESFRTDVIFFILNSLFFPVLLGFLLLAGDGVTKSVHALLDAVFGLRSEAAVSASSKIAITLILFLVWDFGYWLAHYLNHRVQFLWELHKVHHAAEVITPFTNWRVHPLYSVVLLNVLSVCVGAAVGFFDWYFGMRMPQYELLGTNIAIFLYVWTLYHLQHSEFWIPFGGVLGHLLISPAHHQLHHSRDPRHFDRNFGGCLAIWDAMFGTLEVPTEKNPRLSFGLDSDLPDQHAVFATLASPVLRSAAALRSTIEASVARLRKAHP